MTGSHWNGKRAVVCGATAGLGRAFAIELARQRVEHLTLVARSSDNLQALRSELLERFASLDVLCLTADLCVKEPLQRAVEPLIQAGHRVDLVIQAVGQSDRGRLVDLSSQRLHELIGVNVLSSLHAVQCFHPLMRKEGGNIVLVGSLASLFAPRFLGGYAIAKHGLAALAQQARLELAEDQIHVLLACPGPIARQDNGTRYDQHARADKLPEAARQPGGGAKIRGLEPQRLVREILQAAAAKQPLMIRPRKAQWLHWLSALSCSLGDRLLRKNSG
ncbi:MAG: SDR family NAD(P)-dependent oxidoreductase [Pirellulaceae bacterium]